MRVVVYGVRGNVGSEITKELLRRGHQVIGVSRTPGNMPEGVVPVVDDASNVDRIAEIVSNADAVVSAIQPPMDDLNELVSITGRLAEGVKRAGGKNGGPRLLVVGGSGSLYMAGPDGRRVTLLESGYLPAEFVGIATAHRNLLEELRANHEIDWTCLSPAAFFQAGPRTGKFRVGKDDLVVGANGKSEISFADYAIAAVDELERGEHRGERFAVGY